MRRAALVALACAGVAFGVIAEQQAYAWRDLSGWLPDLLAGWTLIGLGIALLGLRRPRGAAALLLLAGFSWFAFNFENTGPAAVQWLAVHAAYLHRAPLLQLALAAPDGTAANEARRSRRRARLVGGDRVAAVGQRRHGARSRRRVRRDRRGALDEAPPGAAAARSRDAGSQRRRSSAPPSPPTRFGASQAHLRARRT